MKWKRIDPENLPEGEVLAGNFEPTTDGFAEKIIGKLYRSKEKYFFDLICCESDYELIPNVTHYIDIHDTDNDPKYITN